MNQQEQVLHIIHVLRKATRQLHPPMITSIIEEFGKDPYLILIACLLSLRARDVVTLPIARRLFQKVQTPYQMIQKPRAELEHLLRPLGFFKRKATVLHQVSQVLIDKYNGMVPATEEELLALPGVGRKTANLVLGQAYDTPAICVDTHVHRISNQLGLVHTKTPEQTELALKKILPPEYWVEWNGLLVVWGQNKKMVLPACCDRCVLSSFRRAVGQR